MIWKKVTLLFCRLIIKIALVFSFGLLVYKKSSWHYFPDPNTILVKSEVKEIKDYDVVKIYQELNGMQQNDSFLIDFIKNNVLIKPDNLSLNLTKIKQDDYYKMRGQLNQAIIVEQILDPKANERTNKLQGFFIEAGAADGEYLSNTLYFEIKYGWTGLLVEPNPDLLRKLYSKHRNAYILPHCLSTKPEVQVVDFAMSKSKLFSGIRPKTIYDERSIEVSDNFMLASPYI